MANLDLKSATHPIAGGLSRRATLLLALGAITIATALAVILSRATLDDAYITFRYALSFLRLR
jgi:hypothetical protein